MANAARRLAITEPLRERVFRRIWISSVFSNLGQQMQAVAAAWTMLQLTHRADLVAMVQTAAMLPIMLLALVAGAIADMYDRRKVTMIALMVCVSGAGMLATVSALGLITPALILIGCFITGAGMSLYSPAWQASAAEIVGVKALPAAVALYSMSNNAARSVGPALGGIVIATVGMVAAFAMNTLLFIPLILALFMWKRQAKPPRLPPERLDRAMLTGLRYVRHSPPIRRVLVRCIVTSMGGAAIYAMTPLVAHHILQGGPGTYGILLGGFGLGAVTSAIVAADVRGRYSAEALTKISSIILGFAILLLAFSPYLALSVCATIAAGSAWMISISIYNVAVQLSAPRWVSGRALSTFHAAISGGLAGGALLWGDLAEAHGVVTALLMASAVMLLSPLLGFVLRVPDAVATEIVPPSKSDPVLQIPLTGRSGPIVVEIEYRIATHQARDFFDAMRGLRRSRERNGAFDVSLARNISDPEIWVERFHYPTWNDYLRARDRLTADDSQLRDRAQAFHKGDGPPRITRMLERPTGSVRWREDALDPGDNLSGPGSVFGSG